MSNTLGTKRLGTVLALIVAFAIALAMVVTPAAFAQDERTPGVTSPQGKGIGNIKEEGDAGVTEYSLTIHKYAAPGWETDKQSTDGKAVGTPPADAKKLDATFVIYKVEESKVNLKTQGGWDSLKTLKPAQIAIGTDTKATPDYTAKTTGGVVKTVLPKHPAVYLVKETVKPEGVKLAVPDFLVTVPFPAKDGTWNYDVNVYPKNVVDGVVTKSVATDTPTTIKGSNVKWTMEVPIPRGKTALKTFVVKDRLHSLLSEVAADSTLTIKDATKGDFTLVRDTHYSVAMNKANGKGTGRYLTVTFKPAGIAELNKHPGEKIEWVLVTKIADTANLSETNKIYNQLPGRTWTYTPDGGGTTPPGGGDTTPPDQDTPPNPPADTPAVFFGDYKFTKVETGHEDQKLSGATFEVYAADASGDAIDNSKKIAGLTVTSGQDGVVTISGLYVGSTTDKKTTKNYFVVETKAPAGFTLDPTPHKITVKSTTAREAAHETLESSQNITNTKSSVPELPLTGASGKLLMTLGGAAILLFAAGTVLVTRRRKA